MLSRERRRLLQMPVRMSWPILAGSMAFGGYLGAYVGYAWPDPALPALVGYQLGASMGLMLGALITGHRRPALLVFWLLIGLWIPAQGWAELSQSRYKSRISAVKGNLHMVQQGLERYAGEHGGYFPPSLHRFHFDWERYIPSSLASPYTAGTDTALFLMDGLYIGAKPARRLAKRQFIGVELVEANIAVYGEFPYVQAQQDRRQFSAPAKMRYYVDKTRHNYALTGGQREGLPIYETCSMTVYTLHN